MLIVHGSHPGGRFISISSDFNSQELEHGFVRWANRGLADVAVVRQTVGRLGIDYFGRNRP
jgi:hypothetical protein